MNNKIKRGTNW